MRPRHHETVARRKLDILDLPEAKLCSWDASVRGVVLYEFEHGGRRLRAFVSDEEHEAELLRFEATGKCHECGGDGQEWRGWNNKTGHRWETCRRCGGSGRPKEAA